ncbi:hypothetical protein [Heyndrickxia sporothermodurans]|nr:hypothetical protein [Heyndrickxia sporothermodurans]
MKKIVITVFSALTIFTTFTSSPINNNMDHSTVTPLGGHNGDVRVG